MATALERPAVDVAPRRTRTGLTLLLAVLSLPGSTVAWELPGGGLWIGLPLGVAAIVLGVRARRGPCAAGRSAIVAIALATLAIGQMAVCAAVLLIP